VVKENRLPIVAALNDMDRHAGQEESALAGHEASPVADWCGQCSSRQA
jgi:hypothetical protein